MKKTLLAGFIGEDNSAKLLLDKIEENQNINKLYLENSFEISEKQITDAIKNNHYDTIIVFGQKPLIKSIYIELVAYIDKSVYSTNYNYKKLKELLVQNNYNIRLSRNAGKYLCNHVYGTGLKYIKDEKLPVKMLFIHIPHLKNIDDIDKLAGVFTSYSSELN